MNQKARQEATNQVESDFSKLLNNANFGFDCRNNLDNCKFELINDEINELSFINAIIVIYMTKTYNRLLPLVF